MNERLDHRDRQRRSRGVGAGANCGGSGDGGEGVGRCGGIGVARVGGGGGVEEGQERSKGETGDEEQDEETVVRREVRGDAARRAGSRFVKRVKEDQFWGDVWVFHALLIN